MGQNKMQTFNEFTVTLDENGKVLDKMPTKRKTVRIYPHEAEYWNGRVQQNKLYYEASEEIDEKTTERIALEKQATELEIKFRSDISDEKLQIKINEAKSN